MGFDTDLFVNQPVDGHAVCSICHLVLEKPIVVCKQGHTYCGECMDVYTGSTCPDCRDAMLQGIILDMKVNCPAKDDDDACGWKGRLEDYSDRHSKIDCPFLLKKCEKCNTAVRLKDLDSHKQDTCPKRYVRCPLCSSKVRLDQLDYHKERTCFHRLTDCSNCQSSMKFLLLEDHSLNECPGRQVCCQDCSTSLTARCLDQHKKKICPDRKVVCDLCSKSIKASFLEEHLNSNCQNTSADPLPSVPFVRKAKKRRRARHAFRPDNEDSSPIIDVVLSSSDCFSLNGASSSDSESSSGPE